eukprot:GILJ01000625.1.p1 GENE.GILJ01000625.1~~GILJ01000625.1.p1  ORF type:complete len:473 (+),score=96.00 GILJ01000625.1:42-1421(+)
MALTVEEAKAFLMKESKGDNVYDHLTQVLAKILLERPDNAVESLEQISRFVKQTTFKHSVPKEDEDVNSVNRARSNQVAWIDKMKNLFAVPMGEDGSAEAVTPVGHLPDVMEEARLFEWAGIGLSTEDVYRLLLSLRKLASDSSAKSLRFWGKVTGLCRDYIVAEGLLDEVGEADSENPAVEPRGVGANKYRYWVCHAVGESWVELPDTTPQQLNVARKIRHLFTGDLEAEVVTHPFFNGREKHLLRAQIARITAGTVICPNGVYRFNEDDESVIEEDPEYKGSSGTELADPSAWVHLQPHILKSGRQSHSDILNEEGEVDEAAMEELNEADPVVPLLKSASEDEALVGSETAWVSRSYGDKGVYTVTSPAEDAPPTVNYTVAVLRSLRWPGAVAVSQGKRFANIYFGNGLKAGTPSFFPTAPADIQSDPEEPEVASAPTPEEEAAGNEEHEEEEEDDE